MCLKIFDPIDVTFSTLFFFAFPNTTLTCWKQNHFPFLKREQGSVHFLVSFTWRMLCSCYVGCYDEYSRYWTIKTSLWLQSWVRKYCAWSIKHLYPLSLYLNTLNNGLVSMFVCFSRHFCIISARLDIRAFNCVTFRMLTLTLELRITVTPTWHECGIKLHLSATHTGHIT